MKVQDKNNFEDFRKVYKHKNNFEDFRKVYKINKSLKRNSREDVFPSIQTCLMYTINIDKMIIIKILQFKV